MPATRSAVPPAEPISAPAEARAAVVETVVNVPVPEPRHALGCPPDARMELFTTVAPSGQVVTVNRCIECGQQALVA